MPVLTVIIHWMLLGRPEGGTLGGTYFPPYLAMPYFWTFFERKHFMKIAKTEKKFMKFNFVLSNVEEKTSWKNIIGNAFYIFCR
jgi:hypothetical protein